MRGVGFIYLENLLVSELMPQLLLPQYREVRQLQSALLQIALRQVRSQLMLKKFTQTQSDTQNLF